MRNQIVGTTMPVLEFVLDPNDSIISEAGQLSWMGSSIQMTTHTQYGGGGGVWGAIKRVAGGGTLFMTEYRAMGASGELAFATKLPGHIVPMEVGPGREYMIHRHGFLCSTPQVQIGIGFQQSLGAGIFGGSGFVLQHVGAFQTSVRFEITTVPGIKNMIFGGDGIFLASLTGPGRVWLQTLPIARLAHELMEYMPIQSNKAVQGGVVGGIIGSILDSD